MKQEGGAAEAAACDMAAFVDRLVEGPATHVAFAAAFQGEQPCLAAAAVHLLAALIQHRNINPDLLDAAGTCGTPPLSPALPCPRQGLFFGGGVYLVSWHVVARGSRDVGGRGRRVRAMCAGKGGVSAARAVYCLYALGPAPPTPLVGGMWGERAQLLLAGAVGRVTGICKPSAANATSVSSHLYHMLLAFFVFSSPGWREVATPEAEVIVLCVSEAMPGSHCQLLPTVSEEGVWWESIMKLSAKGGAREEYQAKLSFIS